MYDYVLVGSGPSSLTLALYLSTLGKKIIILEKDSVLGGCHHVKRVNGLFSEHGPRVYNGCYVNFARLLKDFNIGEWDDFFKCYDFSIKDSISTIPFNLYEFVIFAWYFLRYAFVKKTKTMKEFMDEFSFRKNTKIYIDRYCRLLDGGDLNKMTVYEFFETINQVAPHNSYQPKYANDHNKSFLMKWIDRLKKLGVEIRNNTTIKMNDIIGLGSDELRLKLTNSNNDIIRCKNLILCIPPRDLREYADLFNNKEQFNHLASISNYINYISLSFHWKRKQKILHKWGFTELPWGILYIVLSDYFIEDTSDSVDIISLAISITDVKGFNGKSANESTREEVIEEAFKQLKTVQSELEIYDAVIFNHETYDQKERKWKMYNTAFIDTGEHIASETKYFNVFNCGAHNGNGVTPFTTLEAAVQNAIVLYNKLEKDNIALLEPSTLKEFIILFCIAIIMICLLIYNYIK